MSAPSQRRGFLRGDFTPQGVYAELDYVHQVLNGLDFPSGLRIFQDYEATVQDSRIYCLRPGLTIRLPVLRRENDGYVIFIQDRSGDASGSPITIQAPPGQVINGAATVTISANYGKKAIQWSFDEGNWFEVI